MFFPCLSVCLLARLLKNACMDLMKCCLSTDVLINMDWLTFEPDRVTVRMPEPDCFLRYRISAATRNFTSGKSHVHVLAAWFLEWAVVLKWFYSLSCRINFVGGTSALPSAALLVIYDFYHHHHHHHDYHRDNFIRSELFYHTNSANTNDRQQGS